MFFCCSFVVCWPLYSGDTKGTVISSHDWMSNGLQSSPTRRVFIQNLGCRSLATSTKWIFCRNHEDLFAWFRPTVQHSRLHLNLVLVGTGAGGLSPWPSSSSAAVAKAIWPPSCSAIMARGILTTSHIRLMEPVVLEIKLRRRLIYIFGGSRK